MHVSNIFYTNVNLYLVVKQKVTHIWAVYWSSGGL